MQITFQSSSRTSNTTGDIELQRYVAGMKGKLTEKWIILL